MKVSFVEGRVVNDDTARIFEICSENGFITGCFSERDFRIYVWAVGSRKKGFLKEAMNVLCKTFNCTNIEFTNVITGDLIKKLRGFRPVIREFKGEEIICLEGKWEVR